MNMLKKLTIRVPATSANCGPGFDSLGLACTLYNYFTFEIIDSGLELEVEGEGKSFLHASKNNLAFKSFFKIWNKCTTKRIGLRLKMQNSIPLSRGLGSSSTAIVAGLMAANAFFDNRFSKDDLVNFATAIEGHPDNVAPAILGGFTVSYMEQGIAYSLKISPVKKIQFVAVVPQKPLSTALARKAIPTHVLHQDAVFNTSRSALLIGCLLTGDYQHLSVALEDKLHQPYRASLIAGIEDAFKAAKENGAYNAIISGAGSTLMAYVPAEQNASLVGEAMVKALEESGQAASYHLLELDNLGATIV